MLLDDHLTNPLAAGEAGKPPPFIEVDEVCWRRQLIWSERWETTLGCAGYAFLAVAVTLIPYFGWAAIPVILISLLLFSWWKYRNIKKYAYLREHARLSFVVYPDRIVRYTATNYQVFAFADLRCIHFRSFGIELRKQKCRWPFTAPARYHFRDPDLCVVPKALAHYPDIKAFMEGIEGKHPK